MGSAKTQQNYQKNLLHFFNLIHNLIKHNAIAVPTVVLTVKEL